MTINQDLLAAELLRWGMVHKNVEYYTQRDRFEIWHETTLAQLGRDSRFNGVEDNLTCYLWIVNYFRENSLGP